jgi:hypothetical protein
MRFVSAVVVFASLLMSFALAQNTDAKSSSVPQRYQLVPAQVLSPVDATTAVSQLFLLDTQTGRVWRYNASSGSAKDFNGTTVLTGGFIPVDRMEESTARSKQKDEAK